MKKMIIGICIGVSLSFSTLVFASPNTLEVLSFPVKYVIDGAELPLGEEYVSLYYQGHIYAPVRFIADSLAAKIEYRSDTNTLTFDTPPVRGIGAPHVNPDQAKLTAYEKHHLKHVEDDYTVRLLTDDEKTQIPEEAKNKAPVYYFLKGQNEAGETVTVCVWSMNRAVSFLYHHPEDEREKTE